MLKRVSLPLLVLETRRPSHLRKLLEPCKIHSAYMALPFLGCCSSTSGGHGRRSYQERKLQMLTHWRDAVERQLSALNAAITTLQQQMERDASVGSGS